MLICSGKLEFLAQLTEANEEFRITKAENIELKERVEILYKLARSYINRMKDNEHCDEENMENFISSNNENNEASSETVTWQRNNLRGFRRSPKPIDSGATLSPNPTQLTTQSETKSSPRTENSSKSLNDRLNQNEGRTVMKKLYCHYFSNYGTCDYEKRTRNKCKFEHSDKPPMCENGTSCSRSKCMYRHPNSGSRKSNFLDRNTSPQPVFVDQRSMNPWPVMNPWWLAQQGQMSTQNPWQINLQPVRR